MEHLIGLFYALCSQLALIIEARRVDEHHGAEGEQLHSLIYRVSRRALLLADDGQALAGDGIDKAGFTGVTSAEDANMNAFSSGSCIHTHKLFSFTRKNTRSAAAFSQGTGDRGVWYYLISSIFGFGLYLRPALAQSLPSTLTISAVKLMLPSKKDEPTA